MSCLITRRPPAAPAPGRGPWGWRRLPAPPARSAEELEALVGAQVVVVATQAGQVLDGGWASLGEGHDPVVPLEALGQVTARDHAVAVQFEEGGVEGGDGGQRPGQGPCYRAGAR